MKLIIVLLILIVAINLQFAYAETFEVSIPQGTSAPGCEETNTCFIPFEVIIMPLDTVNWINDDVALHVVWSGNPQEGPNGIFDSPLIFSNEMFSHTFNEVGTFPYFDPLHPWMTGIVIVLQPVGGEMIPINTTSLLLAGTYSNASWMIPVIVSGIGIGFVIVRRYHNSFN